MNWTATRVKLLDAGVPAERLPENRQQRIDLRSIDLRDADLRRTNLTNADLRGAFLHAASLEGARLEGAKLEWRSHDLVAELLRRHAGDNWQRRALAGLVLISRDWCWDEFLALQHPEQKWALDVLAQYVRPGDNAPEVLRDRAADVEEAP